MDERCLPLPVALVGKSRGGEVRGGLVWPRESSGWSRRVERNEVLGWMAGVGVRELGWEEGVECGVGGALVLLGGRRVVGRRGREGDVLVRLGVRGEGVVVPGISLEERCWEIGYEVVAGIGGRLVGAGGGPPWGLAELAYCEAEHARGWLLANVVLGKVAVLGPMGCSTLRSQELARRGGFVDSEGGLTRLGWWRLGFEAGQGVGVMEKMRGERLAEAGRRERGGGGDLGAVGTRGRLVGQREGKGEGGEQRRKAWSNATHTRAVQRECLELMESEGATPLGVEYSATGAEIYRLPKQYRADALLLDREGRLIWVEVMRRGLERLREHTAAKYSYLERTFLPVVATAMGGPVRSVLVITTGVEKGRFERVVEPLRGGMI